MGFFQWVEVFALDVFDQGHDRGRLVGHIAHQHRHALEACDLRGPKAAFTGNDFVQRLGLTRVVGVLAAGTAGPAQGGVSGAELAHQDGLHDALAFDALGQLIQSAFVHACARLVGAGHQLAQGQFVGQAIGGRGGGFADGGAKQGFEAAAQAFGFFGCHGGSGV